MSNTIFKKIVALSVVIFLLGISSISISGKTIEKKVDSTINSIDEDIKKPISEGDDYPFLNPPNDIWKKTYGGDKTDIGEFVQQTSDESYIIAGATKSFGGGELDVWLIKTDIDGNELWNKTFGGSYEEWSHCVRATSDGGYIISGAKISSSDNKFDTWLIKTDANGNLLWNKLFSRIDADSSGGCILEMDDGYIVLSQMYYNSGPKNNDIWLIKTDIEGNEQWNKLIGEGDFDYANSIIQTSDGDFVITGYASPNLLLLIKIDPDGNVIWRKTLDGEEGKDLKECVDGGYIIAGRENVCLIRTDEDGNLLWKKDYQWIGFDVALSVDLASDGGFIVSGNAGVGLECDMLIVKTDGCGNREWQKLIGRPGVSDTGRCIIQSNDGTYVVTGETYISGQDDMWLVKVGPFENTRPSVSDIDGPTSGKPFGQYTYSIIGDDPEDENLYYWFEWDDNTYTPWQGPYSSDETCSFTKFWMERGVFTISIKATDIYAGDSEWATLKVTMPRARLFFHSDLVERLFCDILQKLSFL